SARRRVATRATARTRAGPCAPRPSAAQGAPRARARVRGRTTRREREAPRARGRPDRRPLSARWADCSSRREIESAREPGLTPGASHRLSGERGLRARQLIEHREAQAAPPTEPPQIQTEDLDQPVREPRDRAAIA